MPKHPVIGASRSSPPTVPWSPSESSLGVGWQSRKIQELQRFWSWFLQSFNVIWIMKLWTRSIFPPLFVARFLSNCVPFCLTENGWRYFLWAELPAADYALKAGPSPAISKSCKFESNAANTIVSKINAQHRRIRRVIPNVQSGQAQVLLVPKHVVP